MQLSVRSVSNIDTDLPFVLFNVQYEPQEYNLYEPDMMTET